MEDDDIRQLLHATYTADGREPTVNPGTFEQQAKQPHRSNMATPLIAVVAALVVAVPVGVVALVRGGVIGGSGGSTTLVEDLHMYGANEGWAWAGGNEIMHTTSGVQHWTIVPPPIGNQAIVGVAWAGADSARILAAPAAAANTVEQPYTLTPWMTDNAGATWTQGQPFRVLLETGEIPSNGSSYADLDFVDPLHGWFFDAQMPAVGAPMFVYRTVDGGVHWSQVEMTPASGKTAPGALPVGCSPYGMTFVSTTTGWVTGSCGLATLFDVTHDRGATWAPQTFPCTNCALYPPQFASALDGQLFGENGMGALFVTSDGGRTWTARTDPSGEAPDFIDADHGFTMGLTGNINPAAVLWRTTDGGATWSQAPNGAIRGNGPAETGELDFISATTGWMESLPVYSEPVPNMVPPQLWQTTDAGSTWTLITPTFTTSK
jgi:photosystem II stability/assembly factor-like uncharacterized protein